MASTFYEIVNLFLRYLTNDVPEQADAVERLLERIARGGQILAVHSMVVAEIVWTLESFYQLSRPAIKEKILAILNTPGLEVEDGALLLQAVSDYAEKNVDFIDAYSAAWMQSQGLEQIYTFDRRHFSRFDGLKVLVPGQDDIAEEPPEEVT